MWTLQDAKNRFSAVVEAALSGEPQRVSRRGRPAVVVLSEVEYGRLLRRESKPLTFKEHLLSFPQGGSDDLDFEADRRSFRMRDVEF